MHQGARAGIGEQFDQHRVLDLAVENDHALDPGLERSLMPWINAKNV